MEKQPDRRKEMPLDVNPKVLTWARETICLSVEEAAKKLQIKEQTLVKLEKGDKKPLRAKLVKMASVYHQPLLTFYLSEPPKEEAIAVDFRKLPKILSREDKVQEAYLDMLLRDVKARQEVLSSALEDDENLEQHEYVGSLTLSENIERAVKTLKDLVKFDLDEFRKKTDHSRAFSYLRDLVQNIGVFVLLENNLGNYRTAINVKTFRGFALANKTAPFIVINRHDRPSAKSFTLLHELTHILLGESSVSNKLSVEQPTEKFCNDVAGEVLFPQKELDKLSAFNASNVETLKKEIAKMSKDKNISHLMIAYQLFRAKKINHGIWRKLELSYTGYREASKYAKNDNEKPPLGPGYYTLKRFYNGQRLILTVKSLMESNLITSTKAGFILDVHSSKLLDVFDKRSKPIPHNE